eukprot:3419080-Amphidinium_carterae.1
MSYEDMLRLEAVEANVLLRAMNHLAIDGRLHLVLYLCGARDTGAQPVQVQVHHSNQMGIMAST